MAGMSPSDVYELTGVSDPRVSPDGSTVAFVITWIDRDASEYRSNIWLAPVDGAATARQLTFGEKRDADPRWSPDGRWLAFASDRAGDDTMHLYVMPIGEPGEPRKLTDLKESVEQAAWSPEGSRIAFSSRVRDAAYEEEDEKKRAPRRIRRLQFKLDKEGWTADRPHHLFVVPADGSAEPRQLTDGDYEDVQPAWSPDGRTIAFVSARHDDWDVTPITDVYLVDADGGQPRRATGLDGGCSSPSWSPDGTRIAYHFYPGAFDDPRHTQVAVADAATGERTILTSSLDRTCSPYPPIREPIWDGESLVFVVEDRGNEPLYRVPADGSAEPEPVLDDALVVTGYDAAGGRIVHTRSTPTSLPELYHEDLRLTDVGGPFADGRELCAPERFTAVSPDGTEVDAWILRPAGFEDGKRYPLLLNIHGGPFTQYAKKFFDEFQVYAGSGYAVVYSNPRGSSGYSEAWGRAIRGPEEGGPGWGSVDYEDLMAVVDETVKRFDFVDGDRMGVMGGSYGGYMTTWVVGHTDRFRCAVSERAVNDLLSEDGASDLASFFKGYTGAYAWDAPEAYLKVSPWSYAKDITTPLLIIHSEEDHRCPIGQGEELFTVLRANRREVELVRFPGECHELSRSGSPAHRVMRFEIILEWLDRHLKA